MTDVLHNSIPDSHYQLLEFEPDVTIRVNSIQQAEQIVSIMDTSMYVEVTLVHSCILGMETFDLVVVSDEAEKLEGYLLGIKDTLQLVKLDIPENALYYRAVYHNHSYSTYNEVYTMYTFERQTSS